MNRKNELTLKVITECASRYNTSVTVTLETYQQKKRLAQTTAKKFKDENQYIRETMQQPTQTAKADLAKVGKQFAADLREKAADLRKEYITHLMQPVSPNVLAQIRLYNDFGIVPSQMETEAILAVNNGVSGGLRALQSVLQKVNAPYQLKFRSPEEFENDIRMIEHLADGIEKMPAIPVEYWPEAQEILNTDRNEPGFVDGIYYSVPPKIGQFQLNLARNGFEQTLKHVEAMSDSWTADASYELADRISREIDAKKSEKTPTNPESSVRIEDGEKGMEFARQEGQRIAENQALYEKVIQENAM